MINISDKNVMMKLSKNTITETITDNARLITTCRVMTVLWLLYLQFQPTSPQLNTCSYMQSDSARNQTPHESEPIVNTLLCN